MSEYKASCYALWRAANSDTGRELSLILSSITLNACGRDWVPAVSFGNKSSAEVRADPLLADELNTFYGRFESDQRFRKQQTEQRWLCNHRVGGQGSVGTKESERQESSRTWWDYWPYSEVLSSHSSTSIIKFTDDTVVLGLISNNDETAYLDEVERLTSWYQDNCLSLNVSKTKALIVLSPLCRTSNAAKVELSKSSRTQITLVTVSSFCYHLVSASVAWWQNWET